jgi:hypothetical protein
MIEFKIIDAADQQWSAILNQRRVTLRLRYNQRASERWSLDLMIDDIPVLHGRRVVVGVNLLEPFGFDIGAIVVLPAIENSPAIPGRVELPSGIVRMYHLSPEDLAEAV